MSLWQDHDQIFVKWLGDNDEAPRYLCNAEDCIESLLVTNLPAAARRINFLPGFDGVIIVALGDTIFAIQAEKNPQKIDQVIYQGKAPDFRIFDGSLYIQDGALLFEAKL